MAVAIPLRVSPHIDQWKAKNFPPPIWMASVTQTTYNGSRTVYLSRTLRVNPKTISLSIDVRELGRAYAELWDAGTTSVASLRARIDPEGQ